MRNPKKPMILMQGRDIIGSCRTGDHCFDQRIPFSKDGKREYAYLRSFTWVAAEIIRGRRTVASEKLTKMIEELPEYEALPWRDGDITA